MISLILYLIIGALLLLSLVSFVRRSNRAEGGSGAMVQARQAVNALQAGLLPPELLGRIFSRVDLEFVEAEKSVEIRELFLEERKAVALSWVNRVRQQVQSLKRFHLGSARFYARLSLRTELSLAFDFTVLLFECRMLQIFLFLRGPYAAPRMVGFTAAAAARVCKVSEASLAFLTPVYAGRSANSATGYHHGLK